MHMYMYIMLVCVYSMQRIAHSTRCGGPLNLRLDRFTEALYDKSSGLTFTALTGKRKQSVRDVEILFSDSMHKFMEKKATNMKPDTSRSSKIGGVQAMKGDCHN